MSKTLTDIEKKIIKEKANKVLTRFGFNFEKDFCVDIVKLAKSIGFKIGESDKLAPQDDGFIFVSSDETDKIIGINYYRSSEEKRLITAYQLAYYFLYLEEVKKEIFIKNNIKDKKDAYYFAMCILNPEKNTEEIKKVRKENNVMELYLRNINDNKIYKIYDVSYNSAGYPHFLVFQKNQWIRMSAKYFRPIEESDSCVKD